MEELERSGSISLPLDGEDEEPDPRVKGELENLNQTSAEVNRLENELDEARAKYRMTFSEASRKMTHLAKDKKNSIQKSREYYELREEAKKVQMESLKSTRQYQSAIGIYRAAKETVALAEERLLQGGEVQLTSAWQEMLNHATIRVMEAEKEKRMSEENHQRTTSRWRYLENRTQELERKFKRAISNARGYFEFKQQLDLRLQQQKQNVLDLQQAIKGCKVKYAETLQSLEKISESIHEARRQNFLLMFPRQPGVGAESANVSPSVSELNLEKFEDRRVWDTDDEEYDDSADDDFRKQSMHSLRSFDDVSLESSSSGLEFKFSHNDVTTGGLEVNSSNNDITNYESDENPSYADVTVVESRLCSHHDDVTTAGTGMSTCNDDVYVDVVNSCHGDISGVEIKIESNDVARKDNEGLGGDRTQPTGQFDSEITLRHGEPKETPISETVSQDGVQQDDNLPSSKQTGCQSEQKERTTLICVDSVNIDNVTQSLNDGCHNTGTNIISDPGDDSARIKCHLQGAMANIN